MYEILEEMRFKKSLWKHRLFIFIGGCGKMQ
nr:MAG TPA: hypothetical protein [Bacteriophage sp.]